MALPTRSPLAVYFDALWFPVCLACAVVPRVLNAAALVGVILVGLILLTYEKDRRYPHLRWTSACRTFIESHEWSAVFVGLTILVASCVLGRVDRSDPRGRCVVAATAYALPRLGAPTPAPMSTQVEPPTKRSDSFGRPQGTGT